MAGKHRTRAVLIPAHDPEDFAMTVIQSRLPIFATAGAALLAIGLLAAPSPAGARILMSTSGGGACKAAFSGSNQFIFNSLYAENAGETEQYVVCSFANWGVADDQQMQPIELLRVWVNAGRMGGTATCTAKMGYWTSSASFGSVSTKSAVVGVGSANIIDFLGTDLPRSQDYYTLTLNCKLPPAFRLGLIQRWEPEPTSGNGWTL